MLGKMTSKRDWRHKKAFVLTYTLDGKKSTKTIKKTRIRRSIRSTKTIKSTSYYSVPSVITSEKTNLPFSMKRQLRELMIPLINLQQQNLKRENILSTSIILDHSLVFGPWKQELNM